MVSLKVYINDVITHWTCRTLSMGLQNWKQIWFQVVQGQEFAILVRQEAPYTMYTLPNLTLSLLYINMHIPFSTVEYQQTEYPLYPWQGQCAEECLHHYLGHSDQPHTLPVVPLFWYCPDELLGEGLSDSCLSWHSARTNPAVNVESAPMEQVYDW